MTPWDLELGPRREVRVRICPPPHAHGLGSRWATSSPSVCFSFLFFPPSFSCPFPFCFVFCFISSFFSVFFMSLVRFADHSPPSGSSHIRPSVPVPRRVCLPLVRLARWRRMGLLPHPHSPSFALLAGDEEGRLSCCLWFGFLSVFSRSTFFLFFLALMLFPPRFALMVMHLVAKKSQSSNDPLIQTRHRSS